MNGQPQSECGCWNLDIGNIQRVETMQSVRFWVPGKFATGKTLAVD